MLALLVAAALAAPAPTPQEQAVLLTGVPVVRPLPAPSQTSAKVLGMVDVHATADAVWRLLLDFPGRLPTNPSVTALVPYRPAVGDEQWWAFTVQKFGMTMTYHNHYVMDRAHAKLTHELDPTQKNDIAGSSGVYEISECAGAAITPCTRLYWTVETDFGRALPGVVRTWLGRTAVENFLTDVAARGPSY